MSVPKQLIVLILSSFLLFLGCEKINETKKAVEDIAKTVKLTEEIKILTDDKDVSELTSDEIDEIIKSAKAVASSASEIDIELLNKIYPGLGDNFRDNLLEGVNNVSEGYETKNSELTKEGKEKIRTWKKWFEENAENIKPLSYLRKRD